MKIATSNITTSWIDLGTFGGPSSWLATTNGVTSPGAVLTKITTISGTNPYSVVNATGKSGAEIGGRK